MSKPSSQRIPLHYVIFNAIVLLWSISRTTYQFHIVHDYETNQSCFCWHNDQQFHCLILLFGHKRWKEGELQTLSHDHPLLETRKDGDPYKEIDLPYLVCIISREFAIQTLIKVKNCNAWIARTSPYSQSTTWVIRQNDVNDGTIFPSIWRQNFVINQLTKIWRQYDVTSTGCAHWEYFNSFICEANSHNIKSRGRDIGTL